LYESKYGDGRQLKNIAPDLPFARIKKFEGDPRYYEALQQEARRAGLRDVTF
jgi:hypothetical protein